MLSNFKYLCDMDKKSVLISNFEKRGWTAADPDSDDWQFYWASVPTVRDLFSLDNKTRRLQPNQMVNHFPTFYELTRKDLMVRNLKRYRRDIEREQGTKLPDFIPATFILPCDYNLFVEEFRKNPQSTWIVKPTGKSQGNGIFIIKRLAQLKKWQKELSAEHATGANKELFVISRYIDSPLLIGGRKFDLRLYVLVTSFLPLRAFLYDEGFCRFCQTKYSTDAQELGNMLVHLTNVSIQKQGEEYNSYHGGKWSLHSLRLYLEGMRGKTVTDELFDNIRSLIVHSLKAVSSVMNSDRHCFECYGYDIIINEELKPWLIEVNASPSLATTTTKDKQLKEKLIADLLELLNPEGCDVRNSQTSLADLKMGNFRLIYDEASDSSRTPSGGRKKLNK
ncbi:probable tubulin polyglutamylase TTLL1 [Galendromus occidentalis]|uniref:Polyglutamylase complex subunit TTLL1 n=1 Tax=Galendromus occidentalis TaxID=34638 RepID=A0AAJ6W148_9ACAR|nr:probable tubulin polyglutamylase TTLL1 [Galendromus occidentalis]